MRALPTLVTNPSKQAPGTALQKPEGPRDPLAFIFDSVTTEQSQHSELAISKADGQPTAHLLPFNK